VLLNQPCDPIPATALAGASMRHQASQSCWRCRRFVAANPAICPPIDSHRSNFLAMVLNGTENCPKMLVNLVNFG
jgi:hypothetical protein